MFPSLVEIDLATVGVNLAFFMALSFIAVYTCFARWWRSEIGWARISLDFGIALALLPTELHYLFGVVVAFSPAWIWFQIVSVFFVASIGLWNIWLVIKYQHVLPKLKRVFRRA